MLYFVWKGLDPFGYFLSVGTSRGLLKPPVSVPEEKEGGGGVWRGRGGDNVLWIEKCNLKTVQSGLILLAGKPPSFKGFLIDSLAPGNCSTLLFAVLPISQNLILPSCPLSNAVLLEASLIPHSPLYIR